MSKTPLLAAAAALFALSACNSEPETIKAGAVEDPQAKELAKAAPVELPPAIAASRTFRCRDNSLVYATYYTNDTVKVSGEQGPTAPGTILTAEGGNPPYVADGYSLSANADEVEYTAPGKGSQGCSA